MKINILSAKENFFDVVILGSGIAGIIAALELEELGAKVLVIEAGKYKRDEVSQKFYKAEILSKYHSDASAHRSRRFGGTSDVWGGRCVPYDEIDFKKRDHIPDSGWDFEKEYLNDFYSAAHKWLKIGPYDFSGENLFGKGRSKMIEGLSSDLIATDNSEIFTFPIDLGKEYKEHFRKSNSIFYLIDCQAFNIDLAKNGKKVTAIKLRDKKSKTHLIECKFLILAMGCLETTRILLSSNKICKKGIGNHADLLGRFYQSHLSGTLGTLKVKKDFKTFFDFEKTKYGDYGRRRLVTTSKAQLEYRLANFVSWPEYPDLHDHRHNSGVLSAMYLAKNLRYFHNRRLPEYGLIFSVNTKFDILLHILNIIRDFPRVIKYGAKYIRYNIFARRKLPGVFIKAAENSYQLHYHVEQVPNFNSRIMLSKERDINGDRLLSIDWNYKELDVDSIVDSYKLIRNELRKSGVGDLVFDEKILRSQVKDRIGVGGHHIGTTRMNKNPNKGVVDLNCCIHGLDNIYIASSSVFPTSGQANPSLTIAAIAVLAARKCFEKMLSRK